MEWQKYIAISVTKMLVLLPNSNVINTNILALRKTLETYLLIKHNTSNGKVIYLPF